MKYLEWKWASDAGFFSYYDGEKNVQYKLDGDISVNEVGYTIKWFDEESNSPIYSNDLVQWEDGRANWDEPFVVKCKRWTIFEGKYSKETIIALGAKLHIKVTGKHNGEDVCITLKGQNYFNLSQLLESIDRKTTTFKVTWATDEKNWAVKYKAPIFEVGGERKEDIAVEDVPF